MLFAGDDWAEDHHDVELQDERGRVLARALREYFPAALEAFDDLAAIDTLELLAKAPDQASAARLTRGQITTALTRARRRGVPAKAAAIAAALRSEQLHQPQPVTAAYAATAPLPDGDHRRPQW